jgi:hypothetical protein
MRTTELIFFFDEKVLILRSFVYNSFTNYLLLEKVGQGHDLQDFIS